MLPRGVNNKGVSNTWQQADGGGAGDSMAGIRRSTRYSRKIRPMAFARDKKANAVCWICGQPIDYFLKPSSAPNAWEGDHVVPLSRGGEELDMNNIRASHVRCNRARGNGISVNDIGQQSRIW